MKIKTQILVFIFASTVLIVGFSIGYVSEYTKNVTIADAQQIANGIAREYANRVKSEFDTDIGLCRAMASAVTSHPSLGVDEKMKMYNRIIFNTYVQNNQYLALWVSFELNTFDPNYYKTHGRWRSTVHEFNGKIIQKVDSLDMEKDNVDGLYYGIKISRKETVTVPYYYAYDTRVKEVLVASICVPLEIDGRFAGIAGIDRILDSFQDSISKIKPFPNSFAMLIGSDGSYISHPNKANIGKKVVEVDAAYDEKFSVTQSIKEGKQFSTIVDDPKSGKFYIVYAPLIIGKSTTPWSIAISVPYEHIVAGANENYRISIAIGFLSIFLLIIIIYSVASKITKSLVQTIKILEKLAKGDLNTTYKLKIKSDKDEIGQIKRSVNTLIDGTKATTQFAFKIGQGDYTSDFKPLSDEDILGNALLEMRENLIKVRLEDAKRNEADEKRNWITRGLAQLSEKLRENRGNIEDFSFNILQNLIKYIGANQGGLFIINDDKEDVFIEQIATYAYDRKKILQKHLKLNSGLIGRCVKEKTTIHLKDIPENYIQITSGLGFSTPRNILLIPLMFNEEVYGIIEMASFVNFAPYQIEFVERIAESIASAISNTKISLRTERLLEESNKKSNELAIQEREMRKTVANIESTQEEERRKEVEMNGIIDALTSTSSIVHLALDGTILQIHQSKLEANQVYTLDVIGRNHREFAVESVTEPLNYKIFWDELRNGNRKNRNVHVVSDLDEKWIAETYSPVFGSNGAVNKILVFQTNITETKNQELALANQSEELQKQEAILKSHLVHFQQSEQEILIKKEEIEALKKAVDVALIRGEFNPEGIIYFINSNYADTLHFRMEEVVGKHVNIFVATEDMAEIQKIWRILLSGKSYLGEIRNQTKEGEHRWLLISYIPQMNKMGIVNKIVFLGYDITRSKLMNNELQIKAEQIVKKEEEMNNYIDELQLKQDEILKKTNEIDALNKILDNSILRAELSPFGTIVDINSSFLKILSYKREELISKSFFHLISNDEKNDFRAFWKKIIADRGYKGDINLESKDGIVLSLNSSFLVESNQNRINKIYLLSSDNTIEKLRNQNLRDQISQLKIHEAELMKNIEYLQSKIGND